MAKIFFGREIIKARPVTAYVSGTTAYIVKNASVSGTTATIPATVQGTTAKL